ncbi:MAG: molybdopterin-guanine dinucleotide biosynthesis protein B [Chloroflexi bacterium]|nr:molybdopterin-guanine dinucleotide biosynthesis protein B [Chloroflexota bacterium]
MRPIISVVGRSESGKTTLLESLVAELKKRGYKVAVVKHAGAEGFEIDKEGSDTWRLTRAGSDAVAISSPTRVAVIRQVEHDMTPEELVRVVGWDYDLVLTEGFKKSDTPKIEVHRKQQGKELLSSPEALLAVVTDERLDVAVPQFSKDDIKGLANLIEQKLKMEWQEEDTELFINEARILISPITKGILTKVVLSVVSGVKGIGEIRSLNFLVRRKS